MANPKGAEGKGNDRGTGNVPVEPHPLLGLFLGRKPLTDSLLRALALTALFPLSLFGAGKAPPSSVG